jgi:mannosyltransferase OCH1-like enzyme
MLQNFGYKNNKQKINIRQLVTPFQFKQTYNDIIPLHIYQTWHTKALPTHMFNNVVKLKRSHPRFTYHLFDDNDCREFIKDNFSSEVLWAFDKLIPGAYKADLWRYCILYKNGGIYLDIKFKPINGFRLIALTEKEHFVNDLGNIGIYNALMACKPGNEILLKCINQIVENVQNNFYGSGALEPTGPMLMNRFFSNEQKGQIELSLETLPTKQVNQHLIKYNNSYILAIYDQYRNEQKMFQNKEHYGTLWQKRQIYY